MPKVKMVDPGDFEKPVENVVVPKKENVYPIDELPSCYKLYPEGIKLYGRPLTVKEIKKISGMNDRNYNVILNDILSSAITGYPLEDICVADKLYLIFWLRANTYRSANFVTEYRCEHCGKQTDFSFDVSSFEIKFLSDDVQTEVELIHCGDTVVFKYITIKDENSIYNFTESMKSTLSKFDDDTINLAGSIQSINGEELSLRRKCEYILSLSAEEYAQLQTVYLDMDFGIIPSIKAVCGHADCRGVNEIPVSFRPEVFIPRYKA